MKFTKRPSATTAIAVTALVIAVGGGTAFAASSAPPPDSVGTAQLKDGAVTNAKVRQYSLDADRLSRAARNELNGTAQVVSLGASRTWMTHSDKNGDGHASINAEGAQLGGPNGGGLTDSANDYAGIATNVLNGKTPADLSTISYTESYTMQPDSNRAAPYFKLKLQPAGGRLR